MREHLPPAWVYIDETAFEDEGGARRYGAGAMLLSAHIESGPIHEALRALEHDPDRHDPATRLLDDKTLHRQHFHAAADSKNAH